MSTSCSGELKKGKNATKLTFICFNKYLKLLKTCYHIEWILTRLKVFTYLHLWGVEWGPPLLFPQVDHLVKVLGEQGLEVLCWQGVHSVHKRVLTLQNTSQKLSSCLKLFMCTDCWWKRLSCKPDDSFLFFIITKCTFLIDFFRYTLKVKVS